jgi:hypothetical protein
MKVIRFCPRYSDKEDMLLQPIPAKRDIPQWYKDGEYTFSDNGIESAGLKTCKPFIDVMISGYFLVIPFDIHVSLDENGLLSIKWDGPETWSDFVMERPKALGSTIPVPAGHMPNHLVFSSRWGWKTPRGWSSIVTHPFNRQDLPFRVSSGLIDSDKFFTSGNIPFHIKEGFVGTIEAGTPYAQIIPIKRARWRSFADYGLVQVSNLMISNLRLHNQEYKIKNWVKKEYE